MALARLSVQEKARKDEVVPVRIVIQHPMETGYRVEADGRSVPKNVVHRIACTFAGREVWHAELGSGISANPYFLIQGAAILISMIANQYLTRLRRAGRT